MSQTVRIYWQYILSRLRVTVRPSVLFIRKKTQKLSRRPTLAHTRLLNEPATPVTMRSRLNRQRHIGAATTAVILKTAKINKSKRRLDKFGLGIITWPIDVEELERKHKTKETRAKSKSTYNTTENNTRINNINVLKCKQNIGNIIPYKYNTH